MNELEQKKPELSLAIKNYLASDELKYTVPNPIGIVVATLEDKKLAEQNVKLAISELKKIQSITTSAKQALDELKKPILDYEKVIQGQADAVKKTLEEAIQDYLAKEQARQREINRQINLYQKMKLDINVAARNFDATQENVFAKMAAMVEQFEIESANIPLEETEIALENLAHMQEVIQEEIVRAEPVYEEKNFVVTREIEDKETYSIGNEKDLIKWALENKELGLLDIGVKKSVFNAWVLLERDGKPNKDLPFVKKSIKLK